MIWPSLRRIFLVATREYKHHARSKGFWLTMLIVPVIISLSGLVPAWMQENKPVKTFVVIDQSGTGIVPVIDEALKRDAAKRDLIAFKDYVSDHVPAGKQPGDLPFSLQSEEVSSADVAGFMAWGGVEKAKAFLPSVARDGSPLFKAPGARFVRVDVPQGIDGAADPAAIGAALGPYLGSEKEISEKDPRFLSSAIIVPKGYSLTAPGPSIQHWNVNLIDNDLDTLITRALTAASRRALYEQKGIPRDAVVAIEQTSVVTQAFSPKKQAGGGVVDARDRILTIVPVALAMLLWVSIFTVANLLLSGVIEERSNKLIEVLLSSISAEEFMAGKLLGIAGIGLTILAVWLGIGSIVLLNSAGPIAGFAREAVHMVVTGPYLPAFLFYFVTAYLTIASLFLGLGSICNSPQEAQSLLTPLILPLMLPFFLIMPIMQDPNGMLATTLAWVPFYTPFIMMIRLSSNPSWMEVVGASLLTLAFSLLVLWGMVRLFKNAILRSGQPPRLLDVWKMIRRQEG